MRIQVCFSSTLLLLLALAIPISGEAAPGLRSSVPRPGGILSGNPVVFSSNPGGLGSENCGAGACEFLAEGDRIVARIGPRGYRVLPADNADSRGFSVDWAATAPASTSRPQHSASSVSYGNILPGIGLRYYDAAGDLEYDFEVEPGGDPSVLRFSAGGTNEIRILPTGDLWMAGQGTAIVQRRPVAYQLVDGVRRMVAASYRITGPSTFVFALGEYDPHLPLVIDPVVEHATTFGNGRPQTGVYGLATAPDGTILYLGHARGDLDEPPLPGEPASRQHLVTPQAYSTHLTRFSPDLKQAIRSVFIGFVNANSQAPSLLALGPDGGIVVVEGYHDPIDNLSPPPLITTGPFGATSPLPPSYGPLRSAVLKVEQDLQTVSYTTVFRCTGDILVQAVTIASNNDLILAGRTACQDFPVSPGAYHRVPSPGQSRLFIARLNSSGTQMTFSTVFGGSSSENVSSVSLNSKGDYVLTGTTASTDFPVTAGVVRSSIVAEDGFVSVVSANGTSLLASTFVGGTDLDSIRKGGVTTGDDILVAVSTYSDDLPVTENAFRRIRGNGFGALARLSSDLKSLRFLTYLPGMLPINDVTFDADGNTWLSGGAPPSEEGYVGSVRPPLLKPWGDFGAALLKVNSDGSNLVFGTSWFGRGQAPLLAAASESSISAFGQPQWPGSFVHTAPPISTAAPGFEDYDIPIARIDLADPTVCQLALPDNRITMGHQGGAGSFSLEIAPGCPWTVVDNYGTSILETEIIVGLGNAVVPFHIEENASSQQDRLYQLKVIDQILNIRQLPAPCGGWDLSDSTLDFPSSGGTRSINVTLPGGCTIWQRPGALWASTSLPELPYVTGGTIPVTITVAPNAFAARSTVIKIIDREVLIAQAGGVCTATVSPVANTIAASGAEILLQVSTSAPSCGWNAQASSSAVSFLDPDSSTGSAMLHVAVARNPSSQPRTLSLLVAGQPVTLTQAAGECGIASLSNWVDILQAGGHTTVAFQASGSACAGRLETDAPWIIPTADALGPNGSYAFYVLPNTTGQTRRTTATMLGHPVTVQQLGGPATRLAMDSEPDTVFQLNGDTRTFHEPFVVERGVPFTIEAPAFQLLSNDLLAVCHSWGPHGNELKLTLTPQDDLLWLSPEFSFYKPLYIWYQGNPSIDGGTVQQTGGDAPIYAARGARYYANAGPVTFTALDGPNARFVSYSGLISSSDRTVTVPTDTGLALNVTFEALGPDPGAPTLGALVEGAGFRQMPVSPGSIASLFGTNLSDTTAEATILPLPQDLAGSRVLLRIDGIGYAASLFYASPQQINLLVPEIVPTGSGTVELIRNFSVRATLPIQTSPGSPSLFAANDNGEGAPAGYAIRVSEGQQIRTELSECPGGKGTCIPALVEFGSDSDEVFLVLFGTGFRGMAGKPAVSIGGIAVEVDFAGPHSVFVGLDQINVKVPRSLHGAGEVVIRMQHGNLETNPLFVRF